VYNTTALAKGRGEQIEKLPAPPECWVILAKPDIGVSTRTMYQRLNTTAVKHPKTLETIDALKAKNFTGMCNNMGNVLENVTLNLHPEVQQIKKMMQHAGAGGALMSGSGPTIYGLVEQESKAQRVYNGLRGFCQEVYIVRMLG